MEYFHFAKDEAHHPKVEEARRGTMMEQNLPTVAARL